MVLIAALWVLGVSASNIDARVTLVANQEEYREALEGSMPGDTIVLADGVWQDFEIRFSGRGTESAPITLKAQTKGKVVLAGQSNLRLCGEYLVVSGLVFRDGYSPTNTVLSYRCTKGKPANYSRVTEVVIDHFTNPERHETDFWVLMFGRHNRFDHNHLVGKGNAGVTMAVRLDGEENQQNHHRIDHNYFGPRPILGSNGGETLRIGTSHHSLTDSNTLVERNFFYRCNGEVEIVSSKSGGNVFRSNVFFESRGTLTLRHGNNNTIEANVFLGNGVQNTGGIRVINKGHVVRNNYLEGLKGYRFGGGFVVMNGVPDSPINRYHQVENVRIENNSIIDSARIELAAGSDTERSAPPISTDFQNNLVSNEGGYSPFRVYDDIGGIEFKNNASNALDQLPVAQGFNNEPFELKRAANGLLYPTKEGYDNVGVPADLQVLDIEETGVDWYPKVKANSNDAATRYITVEPGVDALFKAILGAKPNAEIRLEPGEYRIEKLLVVDKPVTLKAAKDPLSAKLLFERSALFELVEGGSLHLEGLYISGAAAPDVAGNTVIRTSRYSMVKNYEIDIRNCAIENLDTNHSFSFLKVSKNTFATNLSIDHSTFANISGHVIDLNKEMDDLGRYNAESISISNASFQNIDGAVLDIYRGGTDESTFGPKVKLRKSRISNVGHGKRNKSAASIRLHGAQLVEILENRFEDSKPIYVLETVGEPVTRIQENNYINTPNEVTRTMSDL